MIEKLGKYEIVEKIGVGGFGTVYRGRDPFIKRTVAVKTCQSDDDEIKKRFFREAELSGNLHHRNITTIYDFGVQDGIPYIVQEYLTGEDLDKIIKRGEAIPVKRKLEILQDICDGLGYAHGAGIIHRDIKPSNIRVLANGDVKIMDFGIAKSFQSESNLTQTGITLGTAAYLAPEQIRGEPVDPRTDIFSLGVLAYELFTYQKPFRGEHISTVLFKILNEKPEPISAQFPEATPALDIAVNTAMEKSPVDRYESVAAFRKELSAILQSMGGGQPAADTGARPTAREHIRAVPAIDNSEALTSHFEAGVTPPSGALARSPNPAPADATPAPDSAARAKLSLELMDFRNPSGGEALPPVPHSLATAGETQGGSKIGIFVAAAIVVLAGAGAFYWFKLRPAASPAPAASASTTSAVPGSTSASTSSSTSSSTTAPANASTAPEAAPPPPAAKPAEPPAEKKEEAKKTEEPAPVKKYAASFSTTPNSTLFLDGKEIGDTVPRKTLKLEEGSHRLRFELEDGTQYSESFTIGKGGKDTFFHQFPVGSILITAGPEWKGAKVLVDGKTRSRIPASPLLVSPGVHEIAISSDGIPPVMKTITVQAGKREEIHIAPPDRNP